MSELNALWQTWYANEPIKIPGSSDTLVGFSIAALRTNFFIKEKNIMLDAGISGNFSPDYIFITHGHGDHCANIPFHLYCAMNKEIPLKIYCPKESIDHISNYIDAMFMLTCCGMCNKETSEQRFKYEILPAIPGNVEEVLFKKARYLLEPIQCYHTIPCVGFGFSEIKKSLKPEFKDLSGKELGVLRKSGIVLENEIIVPQYCFLGDTSVEIFNNIEILIKYKTIMVECTFIEDSELNNAIETAHMHWLQLKPFVINNPNNTFILFHFSQRYKKKFVEDFFVSENCPNVIVWAN
jgi:ribonuclease Z